MNCHLFQYSADKSCPPKIRSASTTPVRRARLTDWRFLSKVRKLGREATKNSWLTTAYFFCPLGWEVVQSVVHQPLELTILVRVQASQPNFLSPRKTTIRAARPRATV